MIKVEIDDRKVRVLLEKLPAEVMDAVWDDVQEGGFNVERGAKNRCPVLKVPRRIVTSERDPPPDHSVGQLYFGGRLRSSIHASFYPKERRTSVGTNVYYGPYVEFGTVKMKAQPFLHPALEAETGPLMKRIEETIQKALGGRR